MSLILTSTLQSWLRERDMDSIVDFLNTKADLPLCTIHPYLSLWICHPSYKTWTNQQKDSVNRSEWAALGETMNSSKLGTTTLSSLAKLLPSSRAILQTKNLKIIFDHLDSLINPTNVVLSETGATFPTGLLSMAVLEKLGITNVYGQDRTATLNIINNFSSLLTVLSDREWKLTNANPVWTLEFSRSTFLGFVVKERPEVVEAAYRIFQALGIEPVGDEYYDKAKQYVNLLYLQSKLLDTTKSAFESFIDATRYPVSLRENPLDVYRMSDAHTIDTTTTTILNSYNLSDSWIAMFLLVSVILISVLGTSVLAYRYWRVIPKRLTTPPQKPTILESAIQQVKVISFNHRYTFHIPTQDFFGGEKSKVETTKIFLKIVTGQDLQYEEPDPTFKILKLKDERQSYNIIFEKKGGTTKHDVIGAMHHIYSTTLGQAPPSLKSLYDSLAFTAKYAILHSEEANWVQD
jgi:hypothetical protein